jgi:REP element-mobilizing transposase RayT
VIIPEIEPEVYNAIRVKALAIGGEVFAINGIADHVHLAVTIPPHIPVATYISDIKGSAAFHINHMDGNPQKIYWQRGYGVLSFRKSNLKQVIEYIENQKEHHSCGTTWNSLENYGEKSLPGKTVVCEEQSSYDPYA